MKFQGGAPVLKEDIGANLGPPYLNYSSIHGSEMTNHANSNRA
jgi:hypothetical protein